MGRGWKRPGPAAPRRLCARARAPPRSALPPLPAARTRVAVPAGVAGASLGLPRRPALWLSLRSLGVGWGDPGRPFAVTVTPSVPQGDCEKRAPRTWLWGQTQGRAGAPFKAAVLRGGSRAPAASASPRGFLEKQLARNRGVRPRGAGGGRSVLHPALPVVLMRAQVGEALAQDEETGVARFRVMIILSSRQTVSPSFGDPKFPGSSGKRRSRRSAQRQELKDKQRLLSRFFTAQGNKAARSSLLGSGGGREGGERAQSRAELGPEDTYPRRLHFCPPICQRDPICRSQRRRPEGDGMAGVSGPSRARSGGASSLMLPSPSRRAGT